MKLRHFFLGLAGLFITATAFANDVFNVHSQIFVDGRLIASPQIVAKENQPAKIVLANKKDKLVLTLVADNYPMSITKNAIRISYDIHYKSGRDKLHVTPKCVVAPKQDATIQLTQARHVIEVRVNADKQVV